MFKKILLTLFFLLWSSLSFCETVTLLAISDNGATNWTVVGPGSETEVWEVVQTSDGDTSYGETTSNQNQSFEIETFLPYASGITSIQVNAVQKTDSDAESRPRIIFNNGSIQTGGKFGVGLTYAAGSSSFSLNGETGQPWTRDEINGIGPTGIRYISLIGSDGTLGSYLRTTYFEVVIEYTPLKSTHSSVLDFFDFF